MLEVQARDKHVKKRYVLSGADAEQLNALIMAKRTHKGAAKTVVSEGLTDGGYYVEISALSDTGPTSLKFYTNKNKAIIYTVERAEADQKITSVDPINRKVTPQRGKWIWDASGQGGRFQFAEVREAISNPDTLVERFAGMVEQCQAAISELKEKHGLQTPKRARPRPARRSKPRAKPEPQASFGF